MERTVENLVKAFIGESQARNRYTMYASVARKEGYEQLSEVFLVTADQEREHASQLFKAISRLKKEGKGKFDEVEVQATAPTAYGDSVGNLRAAIAGENWEHTSMYPEFAAVAEEEGLPEIASRLRAIAKAEEHHEQRYLKMLKAIENGFFTREKPVWWVCRECGYMHYGTEPPEKCPSCDHAQAFYQILSEEY
jgi:rubrerythrin